MLPLTFHGGTISAGTTTPIAVTTGSPKVYLVFWGSQWGTPGSDGSGNTTFSGDPQGVAPLLQSFFRGLGTGGETWSGVLTQYCEGVAVGTITCPATAHHVGYPSGGALAGVWYDASAPTPAAASSDEIATEAVSAASHFGLTSTSANRNAQYVVVSPPGTNPDGWLDPSAACAWHSSIDTTQLVSPLPTPFTIAYTNLPYLPDGGSSCGAGAVNTPGLTDGVTIVAGHEYAETVTDQFFDASTGGWYDANGEENGDKCAWLSSGPGAAANVTLTTGTFAMQSTWSNDGSACSLTHPIVTDQPLSRTVAVRWSATEATRLAQMAASLKTTTAGVQKTCVYIVSYLLGFISPTPTPVTIRPPGTAVTYTDTWTVPEYSVIDRVGHKFSLADADATRYAMGIISYLLALGGH